MGTGVFPGVKCGRGVTLTTHPLPVLRSWKSRATGCGRKNTPILEGHSFGWGARHRTAVYVPFSVYTMVWLEEHRAFIVEEFIKNGG